MSRLESVSPAARTALIAAALLALLATAAVGTALAKRDIEQVRRAAHALKGSASTASAHGVADAARMLEKLAAEGRIDAFDDAWVHLSKEASLLLQAPPPWAISAGENSCEP